LEEGTFRLPTPTPKPDPAVEPAPSPASNGHGRRRLPSNLPRQKVIHDLPEEQKPCPGCGQVRHVIGQEVSEQLDYTPAKLTVLEHVRLKYACRACEEKVAEGGPQIVTAEKPLSPIEKGLAAPGLLAHVIVNKYGDPRVQGQAVSEMRGGLSWSGDRTRPQTNPELRRSRAVVGSVGCRRRDVDRVRWGLRSRTQVNR
jgi:transposase